MIQIEQPEIEALIQKRLLEGGFASVEEVLTQALTEAPLPAPENSYAGTGADWLETLQRSPFRGLEIDFERLRAPMPVREIKL